MIIIVDHVGLLALLLISEVEGSVVLEVIYLE
jgi:hypothetical protein